MLELILSRKKSLRGVFLVLGSFFSFAYSSIAVASGVEITSYGHSALLIKGGGSSVLINPFKAVGCAAGLKEPKVKVDVILASSELADEGARVAKGRFLVEPGSYRIKKMYFEGISVPHDRKGGRRFGQATLWNWSQGGINFAHLGGAATSLTAQDKVLLGRPDVLIIAVGGGAKVFDGEEAAVVVRDLKPKHVIPVQYKNQQNSSSIDCNLTSIQPFLDAMEGTKIKRSAKSLTLTTIKEKEPLVINLITAAQ